MKYTIKNYQRNFNGSRHLITIEYYPKKKFLRKQKEPYIKQYIGESTVWSEFPSFKSCGTRMDSWLNDLNNRLEYEKEF